MTRIGPKFILLLIVIGAMLLAATGCSDDELEKDNREDVGVDSPSFDESSESADRPFEEEFYSVDLGISRDVVERDDVLGPPTVSEGSRAIYLESGDGDGMSIDVLIDRAIDEGGTYLMTYWAQGQLNQISREWYQGGSDGFSNSEHRSLVAGFAGLEEDEFAEGDSRVVRLHNALRDQLDTDLVMGELSEDGVRELLGDWDMLTTVGAEEANLNELLFFEEDPERDLTGLFAGDAITQLASEGNRSTLTIRVRDSNVIGSLVAHVEGGIVDLGDTDTGVVYTRYFWSKADVVANRPKL